MVVTAYSNRSGQKGIDWTSIGAWVIDLVKALRGGPGWFYEYTFAAGMIAITGAPWWAPVAEYVASLLLESLTGETANATEGIAPEVSPWFIATSGLAISLLSMLGFHRVVTQSRLRAEQIARSDDKVGNVEQAMLEMAALHFLSTMVGSRSLYASTFNSLNAQDTRNLISPCSTL